MTIPIGKPEAVQLMMSTTPFRKPKGVQSSRESVELKDDDSDWEAGSSSAKDVDITSSKAERSSVSPGIRGVNDDDFD